ncbi:MAG: isoleucine--tRNA ligase [Candidatus Omnitrophota bacterium]|nr:isoleucine--tRNA ligase [Candidatus Omnitrophota bacterium]
MDYQKTLNLPQTDFSMKAGLVEKEPQTLAAWEQQGLYAKIRARSSGKKSFILHDGPPYANGRIHIGHALNKILKDIIVKYQTMKGRDALYVPGWDCHGLPIEHQLLKDLKALKADKQDFDAVVFRRKARDYAMGFVGIQREEFKRLGIFGQWDDPYLTLSHDYEHWILKSLAGLVKKGYVYRRLKPVHWCFSCATALAEAEVEYEDDTSPAIYVKFKVNNPQDLALPTDKEAFLLVWTTTPWTLLANVAVAVHPDFTYFAMDHDNEILILEEKASDLIIAPTLDRNDIPKIVGTFKGRDLTKFFYTHPFHGQPCPVVTADYVTKEDGTGLVHIAPGHGQEDYQVGLANNLPVIMPVNSKGVFTEEGGKFAGQHVFKANDQIMDDLQNRCLLYKKEFLEHSYPHCWRCKNPVIFRATEQWFLNVDHEGLRGRLAQAIDKVEWVPPAGKERISSMVASRPDWCLSRQRFWGVPIPALVCRGCKGEHKLFIAVIEHLAGLVKAQGSGVWFEKDIKELLPPSFRCPDCGGTDFQKTHDILDVWFDSGVSHQAVFGPMIKRPLPADLYLEGSDQHRGWFQSSLITAVALHGHPPYTQVLTHGFVVDGQGRKMSKSLGNVMAPQDLIKTGGAEILRLWVASSSYHDDVRISKEITDRLTDAYRKIRNTVRYLLGNLYDFDPDKDLLDHEKLLDLDRWALSRLARVVREADAAYAAYDFPRAVKAAYAFCNEDCSSIYLDILKDRLYTFCAQSPERRSAQTVLYHILDALTRILAPVMAFTAEEIFSASPRTAALKEISSAHLLDWPALDPRWSSQSIEEKFGPLMALRVHVLKALDEKRKSGLIGSALQAKVIITTASDRDHAYLKSVEALLAPVFIVSQVELQKVATGIQGLDEYFSKTAVMVVPAEGVKCARCWHLRLDVGKDPSHPEICLRCVENIR